MVGGLLVVPMKPGERQHPEPALGPNEGALDAPLERRVAGDAVAVPGATYTLQLVGGPAFSPATEVELAVANSTRTLPLEMLERRGDRLQVAWPDAHCGQYTVVVADGDDRQPAAAGKVPVEVVDGCEAPPHLAAIEPSRVIQASGRWTTVVLEGQGFAPSDRLSLEHLGDRRLAATLPRQRFVGPERIELDLPSELRCGDWRLSLERADTFGPAAEAVLGWCPENVLTVLSYNVAMVPAVGLPWAQPWVPFPTAACAPLCWTKGRRAPLLADHPDLLGYDVIVLQELFSDSHRAMIVDGLTGSPDGYGEESGMVPGSWPLVGGGVKILSRWPIVEEATLPFTSCAGGILDTAAASRNDCLASKGVVHAAIEKHGRRHHVFGTHMDAGQGMLDQRARQEQMHALARFIRARRVPADEAVVIAGDLNIDRFDADEAALIGDVLRATYGPFEGCSGRPAHATTPKGGALDYVLYSTRHLLPSGAAVSRVVCPRSGGEDLSDHYAVLGSFVFPMDEPQPRAVLPVAATGCVSPSIC